MLGRKKILGLILIISLLFAAGEIFSIRNALASAMDLNLTVTGTSVACGNSIIETGETCDNGASNGVCPAACSSICQDNDCTGGVIIPPPPPPPPTTTPDLLITGINVSDITDVSANISWNTNRLAVCQVQWGINTDYTGGASSEITYLSSHLSQLTGLSANTTYHYILNCQDSSDIAASSGDKTFKTLVGPDITPPGNVTGLHTQSGNSISTLFWHSPTDLDFAGVIIRRSTVYYPSFSQGSAVYDGQGNPIGAEMSFADSGLVNDTVYYYSVFAYDTAGNHASGVGIIGQPSTVVIPPSCATDPALCPIPPSCTTDPSLCPPPSELPPGEVPGGGVTGDLFFSDFNFSQQGQPLIVGADNRVTAQPDYAITISLPESKILPNTDKIVINLSVGGKMETYLFAYDAGQKVYTATIQPIKDTGVYYASIIVLNAASQSLKTVTGSIEIKAPTIEVLPSLPGTINAAVETVENISNAIKENPTVKAVAEAASSPVGQGTAAALVAVSFATTAISIPMLNWWFLLQFFFTQPLKLFWFRKGWGTVYNAITKKPIDLALVRLYDAKTDRLITSRVTDKNGRYIFLVNPGEYYIKVEKLGFEYPSSLLKHAHDDGSFLDLYYGEKIVISGEDRSAIIANIPLDQEDVQITDAEVLKKVSRARLSKSLSWLGPILAFGYFLFFPSIFSFGLIIVHLLLLFLFRRLAGRKHKKHWGVVLAPDGQKPIKRAITRIFSSEYGRMLEFYVTDDQGRYDFLVGNNKYYVTADKPGYGTAKTPILDLTGKKPEELVIAQDLILPEENKISDDINKPEGSAQSAPVENMIEPIIEPEKMEAIKVEAPTSKTEAPIVPEHIDLGSLDEAREQIEEKTTENVPAETPDKQEIEEKKSDKPNEGIYG